MSSKQGAKHIIANTYYSSDNRTPDYNLPDNIPPESVLFTQQIFTKQIFAYDRNSSIAGCLTEIHPSLVSEKFRCYNRIVY